MTNIHERNFPVNEAEDQSVYSDCEFVVDDDLPRRVTIDSEAMMAAALNPNGVLPGGLRTNSAQASRVKLQHRNNLPKISQNPSVETSRRESLSCRAGSSTAAIVLQEKTKERYGVRIGLTGT